MSTWGASAGSAHVVDQGHVGGGGAFILSITGSTVSKLLLVSVNTCQCGCILSDFRMAASPNFVHFNWPTSRASVKSYHARHRTSPFRPSHASSRGERPRLSLIVPQFLHDRPPLGTILVPLCMGMRKKEGRRPRSPTRGGAAIKGVINMRRIGK